MDDGFLLVGLILAGVVGAIVFMDVRQRMSVVLAAIWGVATWLLMIVFLPIYLVVRFTVYARPTLTPGQARVCPKCGIVSGLDSHFCKDCRQSFVG